MTLIKKNLIEDYISDTTQTELDTKIDTVVWGTNITIDNTDPNNPIINSSWWITESAIYQRGYSSWSVTPASPVFDIANTQVYNDSSDIIKVSNQKITLKGWHKYKIQWFLNCECSFTNWYIDFQLFNATDTAFFWITWTVILSTNWGNSGSVVQPLAYINDSRDIDIELHFNWWDSITSYYAAIVIRKV